MTSGGTHAFPKQRSWVSNTKGIHNSSNNCHISESMYYDVREDSWRDIKAWKGCLLQRHVIIIVVSLLSLVAFIWRGASLESFFNIESSNHRQNSQMTLSSQYPYLTARYFEEFRDVVFVGHLKCDTDAIAAAVAAAHFYNGTAAMSADSMKDLNPETKFVLKRFGVPLPLPISHFVPPTSTSRRFCIVDFNQKSQLPPGISEESVACIIDHHALRPGIVELSSPIHIHIRPVGSTATIISWSYFDTRRHMPLEIAGLLLSAIISDTLNLRGPTTTELDRKAVAHLSSIAGIADSTSFAKDMFAAKSDLSGLTPREAATLDFKVFDIAGTRFGFGVLEIVTPDQILDSNVLPAYMTALKDVKHEKGLQLIFLGIVDIMNFHTDLLLSDSDDTVAAEGAFGGKTKDGILDIGSRVSRKKEFIPPLQEYLSRRNG